MTMTTKKMTNFFPMNMKRLLPPLPFLMCKRELLKVLRRGVSPEQRRRTSQGNPNDRETGLNKNKKKRSSSIAGTEQI
jgi:hypothetical protein